MLTCSHEFSLINNIQNLQMLDSHVCIVFIPEAKSFLMTFGVAAMVVASKDKKLASAAQQLLASPNLRISSSR